MSNEPEMVTVRIVAFERVEYDQEVEMTRADFEKYSALLDEDESAATEKIMDCYIDRTEVLDSGRQEVETFELATDDAE